MNARQTVLLKEIVTDTARCGQRIFRTPREVNRTGRDGTMSRDRNTAVAAFRLTYPVQICHSTTDSPIQNSNQDIINPIGPITPLWTRNAEKLKTSIDGFFADDRVLKPIFSNVVGCKFADNCIVNVNLPCRMNSGSNVVFTQNPNFINLGIASVNTTDKLGSIRNPTTRVGRPTSRSNRIRHGHDIEEATSDRVSETRSHSEYFF